jgi:hypothetical protein
MESSRDLQSIRVINFVINLCLILLVELKIELNRANKNKHKNGRWKDEWFGDLDNHELPSSKYLALAMERYYHGQGQVKKKTSCF